MLARVPPTGVRRIHLVGVAGTGMGSFAGMLKRVGYDVTGSDENVYPPMSDMLKSWGIGVLTPFAAANVGRAHPDLVIVGNVIRRVNPEATEVRAKGLPQMSFPAALGAFFLEKRHSVVVAGTHGKTTTSAMMAHVLVNAGKDPSFLVGGVTRNYAGNYRVGEGPHFVLEGDEYDTAYFDKGAKFLHYRPRTAILTSVELDHVDIYRDLADYESAFARFVECLPGSGFLAVSAAYPNAVALARRARSTVVTYAAAVDRDADYSAREVRYGPGGAHFSLLRGDEPLGDIFLQMTGAHNVENAVGVCAAALSLGVTNTELAAGLASFQGVKRRQEVRADIKGIRVIDDFAHHPTAVRETIAATVQRYPGRPVWAVFEPRSNTSRRNVHQEQYARCFAGAARVFLKVPAHHDKVPLDQELDIMRLVRELGASGLKVAAEEHVEALVESVAREVRPGAVVLVMSNGSFDGFIEALILALDNG